MAAFLFLGSGAAWADEPRRSMDFMRPQAMGGAYVAVADESIAVFYNPAAITNIQEFSVDALRLQLSANDVIGSGATDPAIITNIFNGIDATNIATLAGTSFYGDVQLMLPMLIWPAKGLFFGLAAQSHANLKVLDAQPLPALRVEYFTDAQFFVGGGGQANKYLSYGWNLKLVSRNGVDVVYNFLTLFAGGPTIDPALLPEVSAAMNGQTATALGLDLGLIYRLNPDSEWNPRLALTALNMSLSRLRDNHVIPMEFGPKPDAGSPPQMGQLDQINTIGFAVSPVWDVYRLTLAADYVDYTGAIFSSSPYNYTGVRERLRLGVEFAIKPRPDGSALFSIMGGYNGQHTSWGVLTRAHIFEFGFNRYTVDTGPGLNSDPDHRASVTLALRF